MRDRNETTKTIKQALKERSGRTWSVTGGRGTAWGWLRIDAPKDRLVQHIANPDYVNPWETPDTPASFEVVPAEGEEGHYMSLADRQELADLLGFDRPVHYQGHSVSPDEWDFIVERALNGKPAPEPEPEADPAPALPLEPRPVFDLSLVQPVLTDISAANLFVTARFACLNKNEDLARYRSEVAKGDYRVNRCKVTEIAALSNEGYDVFTNCLLDDFDWIAGKGGTWADGDWPGDFWDGGWTEDQRKAFIAASYSLVIAVTAPNRETIYVNPEGYSYARYVGI